MAFSVMDYMSGIGLVGVIATLTGTQYSRLNKRIDKLENTSLPETKIRTLIIDKLEPVKVQYKAIEDRIDELVDRQKEIERKLDTIVGLLHGKNIRKA